MNRITRAADFRSTVRTGRRITTTHSVVYIAARQGGGATRFGFIVSKAVGNSVVRHRMTRRLRSIGFEVLPSMAVECDVIVRALPGSDSASWLELNREVASAIGTGSIGTRVRTR